MHPSLSGTTGEGSEPERTGTLNPLHESGVTIESPPVIGEGFTIRTSGRYVPVGDRLVPSFLVLELDGDASSPAVSARVEMRDGAPRIVDLHYDATGCGDVRQTHLREVQIDAMVDLLAGFAVRVVDLDDGDGVVETAHDPESAVYKESLATLRGMRANRSVTPDLLREVADVYRANIAKAPTEAVRLRFFVSKTQASNYVRAARSAGFLPKTSPGKKRA